MAPAAQLRGNPRRPDVPRVHAFFDGQNLFYRAKACFGYDTPNFDPLKLAEAVVESSPYEQELIQVHFYTGVHNRKQNKFWHDFWTKKLNAMRGKGVRAVTRPLMYIPVESGESSSRKGVEKGIDLRIGLDLVRFARSNEYDVALIFSQDKDLEEAVGEVKRLRTELDRWIVFESAFPSSPELGVQRGIPGTQWRRFDKRLYDQCIDPTDYRPPKEE
jgi:uncharacterized LabA/DUF88 family protein